jgi:hypothetical protein
MAEDLMALSRPDLEERAAEVGINDPEEYPNKEALVAAIEEKEESTEGEGSSSGKKSKAAKGSATAQDAERSGELTTSDADARVEGVTYDDVEKDPHQADHPSDDPDYAFPPGGDIDVSTLEATEIEGETEAPLTVEDKVVIGEGENVPEWLEGARALIVDVQPKEPQRGQPEDPDQQEGKDTNTYQVRTRDEHNAILFLDRDDFAEIIKGGVAVRGFGT